MEVLINKRERVLGSLTRIEEFIRNANGAAITIFDIRSRIEMLEALKLQFNQIDDQQIELCETLTDREIHYESFEHRYYRARSDLEMLSHEIPLASAEHHNIPLQHSTAAADDTQFQNALSADLFNRFVDQQNTFLEKLNNTNTGGNVVLSNLNNSIRLPELEVPIFNGSYQEWKSFQDAFCGAVHENFTLKDNQKFRYLKGFLRGEPLSLVKHLPTTDANYEEAWTKLQSRYNKPSHIIQSLINSFFEIPPAKSLSTPEALRNLWSKSDEVLRGLRAIGPDAESRDPWLISILLNKVEKETHHAWAEHVLEKGKEFPTINDFLSFLCDRCDAFESCKAPVATQSSRYVPPRTTRVHTLTAHAAPCPKCNSAHFLAYCPQFLADSISIRTKFVTDNALCYNCLKRGHSVRNCKSKFTCSECQKRHHTMLHDRRTNHAMPSTSTNAFHSCSTALQPQNPLDLSKMPSKGTVCPKPSMVTSLTQMRTTKPSDLLDESIQLPNASSKSGHVQMLSSTGEMHTNKHRTTTDSTNALQLDGVSSQMPSPFATVLLPTALVKIRDISGKFIFANALLDSGSQSTFITESCVQQLGLRRINSRIAVNGLSGNQAGVSRGNVNIQFASRLLSENLINASALIIPKITSCQPQTPVVLKSINCLDGLLLADPSFDKPKNIDLLLGADIFFSLLEPGQIKEADGTVIASNSKLGWIVAGKIDQHPEVSCHAATFNENIDELLQRFWELEQVPHCNSKYTESELQAETLFTQNCYRDDSGRYHLTMPFAQGCPDLGESTTMAFKRFLSLERKLLSNSDLNNQYSKFMQEYLAMGHMELVPDDEVQSSTAKVYYLPHHAVLKESSLTTKLRVVFDASAKTTNGKSLNDNLLIGPALQQDLISIILRFRCHKYVFTADVEKMFRMIGIQRVHQDYQRILWRDDPNEHIKHYRLTTVTYGTAPAPFLAIRVLHQLSQDEGVNYPRAADILVRDFYVDDCMSGSDDIDDAKLLISQLSAMMNSGGFCLRKWAANDPQLLEHIPMKYRLDSVLELPNEIKIPVLGIFWNPNIDKFSFKIILSEKSSGSKRKILSDVARIFDPMGWVSPSIIVAKSMLQKLWLSKVEWDDPLPHLLQIQWDAFREQLPCLNKIELPRLIYNGKENIQWHGFCDASTFAYAAVIYCRQVVEGVPTVTIVCAKTKIAPLKPVSVPRLELCAALLLAKLFKFMLSTLDVEPSDIYCWTDSKVVIAWLSSHPSKWKTFVSNRTAEILETLPSSQWKHVSTKHNPADCASRGVKPSDLPQHELWWSGPEWLKLSQQDWPKCNIDVPKESVEEIRRTGAKTLLVSTVPQTSPLAEEILSLLQNISSWTVMTRALAYVLRFIHCCRKNRSNRGPLQVHEINNATLFIYRFSQSHYFEDDLNYLRKYGFVGSKSRIRTLNPYLDENQVLRVGGRLLHSTLSTDVKHQVILQKTIPVARLIAQEMHLRYCHAGVTTLMAILRQTWWIIGVRDLVKSIVHKCTTCYRHSKPLSEQLMGNIPTSRLESVHAFYNTGCDYAGPFLLRDRNGRGTRHTKGYIALFKCMATRAVHLELVSDLSSDSFLAALRRFISRRGLCANMYSDNGSNFVGAARKMGEFHKMVLSQSDQIADYLSTLSIQWHFIPPSSPHFGGIWESGIKNVKYHLKRTMGQATYTFEEMVTILCQIEAILNSRPICAVTESDDIEYLTPGHFTIGRSPTSIPEPNLIETKPSYLTRWKLVQQAVQGFWSRWRSEYITSLQQRPKWCKPQQNIKVGDIVLMKEDNRQPTFWNIGKVLEVYPGHDDLVRVVCVRTKAGIFKRPIGKVAVLPIKDN